MRRKMVVAVLIWVCGFGNNVFAQKENYVWYFGDISGLDFNSGSPVSLNNSSMYQLEGCASICDANGSLLFYTDGRRVWNKNHNRMPNGFELAGGNSSTQSALILPFPGNNMMYYIFTVKQFQGPNPRKFNFSIVDMSLNNGKGDVTVKNTFISSPVCEKLTAVKHSNNLDVWVMVHGYYNNIFKAYLVTTNGIMATPVSSNIGPSISHSNATGYMKFSPDGSKIAYAALSNYVDLFDFDPTTGYVTNEKYLYLPVNGTYGLEFSRSSNYLYCSIQQNQIFQWDISSNIAATINSSIQQINSGTVGQYYGALQMGPDGKIYVAKLGVAFLGVINNPELPGTQCNYIDSAIAIWGLGRYGLPNFITSYFLSTGINTNNTQQKQITIYPNPATDGINISFPVSSSQHITTKIFSVTGEVVFEKENKTGSNYFSETIDVKDFSNGIYFLSVQTEKELMTKKIIVNH